MANVGNTGKWKHARQSCGTPIRRYVWSMQCVLRPCSTLWFLACFPHNVAHFRDMGWNSYSFISSAALSSRNVILHFFEDKVQETRLIRYFEVFTPSRGDVSHRSRIRLRKITFKIEAPMSIRLYGASLVGQRITRTETFTKRKNTAIYLVVSLVRSSTSPHSVAPACDMWCIFGTRAARKDE